MIIQPMALQFMSESEISQNSIMDNELVKISLIGENFINPVLRSILPFCFALVTLHCHRASSLLGVVVRYLPILFVFLLD